MSINNQSVSDKDFVAICHVFDGEENVIPHLVVNDFEEEVEQSPLNPDEKKRLAKCEAEIEESLGPTSNLGFHLRIIKAEKLFREDYPSFEKYCKGKWGISRFHASRLIKADKCIENLKKAHQIGAPVAIPAKDSHARQIADLPEDKQVEVAKAVDAKAGKRKQTAKDWEDVRQEMYPTQPDAKTSKTTKTKAPKVEAKVIPMTVQSPEPGMVLVQLPAEFLKPNSKMPTIHELSEMAITHDNIKDNPDPAKKKEAARLSLALKTWLPQYAKWERKFLNPTTVQQSQAA